MHQYTTSPVGNYIGGNVMSDYESSDSELKRAIALSLHDVKKVPVIDLLSDDEGNDNAIPKTNQQSRAESSHAGALRSSPKRTSHLGSDNHFSGGAEANRTSGSDGNALDLKLQDDSTIAAAQIQHGLAGVTGAERGKMEEERLARARKRKAISISPPPLSRQTKKGELASAALTRPDFGPDRHNAKKGKIDEQSPLRPSNSAEATIAWRQYKTEEGVAVFPVPRSLVNSEPITLFDLGTDSDSETYEASLRSKVHENSRQPEVLSYTQQLDLLTPGIHFPKGVVKKTWAYGCSRKDDIKIEEVLQKDDLEMAVLSSYQWDDEWILRKIDIRKTKLICVVQAKTDEQKAQMLAGAPSKNIKFCFPSMAGQINCMHSKLQLLSHPTYLRVVVPSANLVPYDWGEEGGVMENIVFIIDLPRLPNVRKISMDEITPFGRELIYFLRAMKIEDAITDSILRFDFSNTSHFAFLHSIGGSHLGTAWKRTGYCGLGSAVQELGLGTQHILAIDVLSASIGNINNDFLSSIYLAAQGDNGLTEFSRRTGKTVKNKGPNSHSKGSLYNTEPHSMEKTEENFHLYYPSYDTVASSKGGIGAGGTICFQSKWFDSSTFPRSIMRDCKSQRRGLLMHSKILYVRPHKPLRTSGSRGRGTCVAWAYLGSANLSESAWGRLVRDKTTEQPKLNIRNWECGVIVPVLKPASALEMGTGGEREEARKESYGTGAVPPDMDVFGGVIPVPMVVPGEEYGIKRPWFYSEH